MYTQKITKRYSSAIKAEALSSIGSGLLSKSEAAILYGVTADTIHQWIRRSGRTTLLNEVINIQMPNEVDIIKELTAQKQRLESALAHATARRSPPPLLAGSSTCEGGEAFLPPPFLRGGTRWGLARRSKNIARLFFAY